MYLITLIVNSQSASVCNWITKNKRFLWTIQSNFYLKIETALESITLLGKTTSEKLEMSCWVSCHGKQLSGNVLRDMRYESKQNVAVPIIDTFHSFRSFAICSLIIASTFSVVLKPNAVVSSTRLFCYCSGKYFPRYICIAS